MHAQLSARSWGDHSEQDKHVTVLVVELKVHQSKDH